MNAPTLAALMLVAVAAWSGYTVVNYAERHIWASNDAWVLKVCWGAYVLSWLPIVLLPFEVMNADLTRCSINWTFWSWFRHLGWIVLYWTITVRRVAQFTAQLAAPRQQPPCPRRLRHPPVTSRGSMVNWTPSSSPRLARARAIAAGSASAASHSRPSNM